jgi:hypothetical protein
LHGESILSFKIALAAKMVENDVKDLSMTLIILQNE